MASEHYYNRKVMKEMLPGMRQKAWEQIQAKTSNSEFSIQHKKDIVIEIENRRMLDDGILRAHRTLHVASHTDICYPLALGCRKIDMLDPCFLEIESVIAGIEAVEHLIGSKVKAFPYGRVAFSFPFDFGQGAEKVDVRFIAGRYPNDLYQGEDADPYAYHPDGPIGMLLAHNPPKFLRLDNCELAAARLVHCGYVLANRPGEFANLTEEYECAQVILCDSIGDEKFWEPWKQMMGAMYAEGGQYVFTPLEDIGVNFNTFLRKL